MNKVELGSILQMQSKTLDAIDRLAERLDRIEAAMLKREDVNFGNLSPDAQDAQLRKSEAIMAGELCRSCSMWRREGLTLGRCWLYTGGIPGPNPDKAPLTEEEWFCDSWDAAQAGEQREGGE